MPVTYVMEKKKDKPVKKKFIFIFMRNLILCLFIVTFFSCTLKKRDDMSYSSNDSHKNNIYLTSLIDKDTLARKTILEVIDTVEFYKSRLSEWPDSAVYYTLRKYWASGIDSTKFDITRTDVVSTFQRDTFSVNYFENLLGERDMRLNDMIICADFRMILYQYLGKKYKKALMREADAKGIRQEIESFHVHWSPYFSTVDNIINEIIFEDKNHPLRDYDYSIYYANIFKNSLYLIMDIISVITDDEFHTVRKPSDVTFDSVFNVATEITCKLDIESHKIMISENINNWYGYYREVNEAREKIPEHCREKYDVFLENVLTYEYLFLKDIKNAIESKTEFALTDK